jgi:hypothetical protein
VKSDPIRRGLRINGVSGAIIRGLQALHASPRIEPPKTVVLTEDELKKCFGREYTPVRRDPFAEGELPANQSRVGVLDDIGNVVRWSTVSYIRHTTHDEPEAVLSDGTVHSIYRLCPL